MSTELKEIRGLKEDEGNPIWGLDAIIPDYIHVKMYITRFYGGTKREVSIQLSLADDYIQLDNSTVKELIKTLQDAIGE